MDAISQWSLIQWWPLRAPVLAVTLIGAALLIWRGRQWWSRGVLVLLLLLLVPVNVLTAVNAYYGYFLTVGQAAGEEDDDSANIDVLQSHTKPKHGEVVTISIPAPKSHSHSSPAKVYLPAVWFEKNRPKLPVYFLLNGVPGAPDSWTKAVGVASTLDRWAAAHRTTPPILVMPDVNNSNRLNDTECVNSPRGNMETYLTQDVPAFVQQKFGTQPPGRAWAVAGYSAGATCAATLTLRHPTLFNTFVDMGGLEGPRAGENAADVAGTVKTLFGGSKAAFLAHDPRTLLTKRHYDHIGGWFQQGTADPGSYRAAKTLSVAAEKAGIDTQVVTVPDAAHTFTLWRQAFADSLGWVVGRIDSRSAGRHDERMPCPSCTVEPIPPARHRGAPSH